VTSVTDKSRRRGVLASGGFAHFIHDGFTDCLFVLLPLWATGFGLSHTQVGFLKMCMSGSLAASQVPAGFVSERLGERVVLAAGTLLAGTGFVMLMFAEGFFSLAVILLIAGTGCAVQHPLASSVISTAYEGGGRRAALGMYNFFGDLGKVVLPFSVAAIIGVYGWQAGSTAIGVVGVIAAVLIFIALVRLRAGGRPSNENRGPAHLKSQGWGIRHRRGFAILSMIGMIDTSSRLAFLTFLPFLLIEKGLEVTGVGFALALIFSGGAAGKLICGLVAERLGILRTVVITELATGGLILVVIVADLTVAMAMLPLLGIALNGTSSVLYGTVGDFVDPARRARAFGAFYTLGIGAGAVAPLCYGFVSDAWGVDMALTILALTVFLTLPLCLALRPALKSAEAA
jgi:MFS transporter, FSR family, fosmidomycin resistance protein